MELYAEKLLDNLPQRDSGSGSGSIPIIDLVLDGGIFNGSYLVGALYFIQAMEKKKLIKVGRISGCSVGSIAGFAYLIGRLDLMSDMYKIAAESFKDGCNLAFLKNLHMHMKSYLAANMDVGKHMSNTLFITYHNAVTGKKKTKHLYKNTDSVIEILIRSCFVPFLCDGNLLYKGKYFDGLIPYLFPPATTRNRRTLYLDLFSLDKVCSMVNIRNERTNGHRVLSGMLDIHTFFIKQSSTSMCSYVDNWSLIYWIHMYFKWLSEKVIAFAIYQMQTFYKGKKHLNSNSNMDESLIKKMLRGVYIIVFKHYCV